MPSGAGWKTLSYVRLPERNSRKKGLKFRKKNLMVNILTILTFEKSLEGFILFIPHLEVSWLHAFHFSLRKKMWLRSGEQARIILHLLNKLLLCKDCWPLAKVQQFEDITRLPRKWSISSARIERAPPRFYWTKPCRVSEDESGLTPKESNAFFSGHHWKGCPVSAIPTPDGMFIKLIGTLFKEHDFSHQYDQRMISIIH